MKDSVYIDKEVGDFYNTNYVIIKIDMEKEGSEMKVVERRDSNMEDESVDTNRNEKAVENYVEDNYVEDKIENYFENNEVDYVGRLAPTPSGYMHGTLR